MARRKASRKFRNRRNFEPAVQTMLFRLPGNVDSTIDLSECASLLNRRFYRQGLNWAVAGFTFITDPNKTGTIGIVKIPDTWVTRNSWVKGFHVWNDMNEKALAESDSVKARYTDFKVFMDSEHHADGVAANALPHMGNPATALTPGEWEMSKVVNPDTTTPGTADNFEVIWTGANFPGGGGSGLNAVSLVEGYAASRALPEIQDPNVPADAVDASGATPENWMQSIFNEGTTQDSLVLSDLTIENDQAPYPFENDGTHVDTMYPGGANQPGGGAGGLIVHDQVGITATSIGNTTKMAGTNFYGGLIRVAGGMNDATEFSMLVHLVPGSHRGYLAEPMQDV